MIPAIGAKKMYGKIDKAKIFPYIDALPVSSNMYKESENLCIEFPNKLIICPNNINVKFRLVFINY